MGTRPAPRALVLEDDLPLQRALAAHLEHHGYVVETFESPSEFLSAARARRPDDVVVEALLRENVPPARVLLVDDDPLVARFFRAAFEQEGFSFLARQDPFPVPDVAAEFHPDVLVLDLHMPGCRGSDLVAALRQDSAWAGIPVLILSGETDPQLRDEALQAGADDFASKGAAPRSLVQLVRSRVDRSREIRSLIARDALTGLVNRSTLLSQVEVECALARRRGETASFALLDIDDFKAVTDRFGHSAGDAALRTLAQLLGRRLRREDLPGPYGREELGIVFPGTSSASAACVVDEVREACRAVRILNPRGAAFSFALSAGIASIPSSASVTALVDAADQALHRAKGAGKDRTEVASTPTDPSSQQAT